MEKFRFKSEYENMPKTGNWINMYEGKKTKKEISEQFFSCLSWSLLHHKA